MRTDDNADNAIPARWRQVMRLAATPPLAQFLAGRLLATHSTWVFRVTAGWAVWELTRSPAMLGFATFALLAPQMLLAPWSGVLADRHDKRWVLAGTHAAQAVLMAAVAVLSFAGALGTGVLLALLAAVGVAGALHQSATKTIVGALVGADDLASAISLNSVIFNLAGFIGPALAGVAIAWGGVGAGFALAAAASLLFLPTLLSLPATPAAATTASWRRQLVDGARYTFGEPLIRRLLLLHIASATLARPFMDFLPALATLLFNGGATQAAALTSASGAGAVAGGLWLAQRAPSRSLLPVLLSAMASLALLLIALAWVPWFALSLVLACAAGFCMITRAAAMQTLIQAVARPEMRGRAVSFYALILNAGSIVGALVIGALAEVLGLSWGLTLAVSAALLAWALLKGPLQRAAATHPATCGALA
jgi:MFS family permease